jgi:hypothetical protein
MAESQRGTIMSVFASIAAAMLLGTGANAQTATCSCPTRTVALYKNAGGDASPLLWRFEAYRKSPASAQGKQIICYVRHVENRSADEVRDVFWGVAGYSRDAIPKGAERPSCADFAGEMKPTPDHGPLYHGLSSRYDTTIVPPESGWFPKTAQATATENSPPLRSDFVLDTRRKDGRLQSSHVTIESSASYDGKIGLFSFDIANDGEGPVGVFLNVRAVPEMYKDVPVAEKPFFLGSKERKTFKTFVAQRPEFSPATIVFYGEDGKQAAMGTAGFYVPTAGNQIRSDEELWRSRTRNPIDQNGIPQKDN